MAESRWGGLCVDPEQEFVLAIARAFALDNPAEKNLEDLAPITAKITSWQRVDALLHAHRCTTVTYAVIRHPVIKDAGIVPASFFEAKRDAYRAVFTRTVMGPLVLHRVIDAFVSAGIPALGIKGLAVGTWLYGDAALREHDDIDVLVPAECGERADTVMTTLGYLGGYRPPLYPGESPATANYQEPAGGISVDLSFDPLHVFWQSPAERKASFDGWWVRRQEVKIGSQPISMPGAEDQLLQLARHLQFHGYYRVNWWIDVLLLLHRFGSSLDWKLIGEEAERHSITGGIRRTLEIADSVYGVVAPDAAWRYLNPNRATRLLHRRVWPDNLSVPRERPLQSQGGTPIAPRFISPRGTHPVSGISIFILDRQRAHYVRYLVQRAVPPASWLRAKYGEGRYPVLWARHWQDLRELKKLVQNQARARR